MHFLRVIIIFFLSIFALLPVNVYKIIMIIIAAFAAILSIIIFISSISGDGDLVSCFLLFTLIGIPSLSGIYSLIKSMLNKTSESSIGDIQQSTITNLVDIISCKNDDAISLDMVAQKISTPPAIIGEYISNMLFDVLNELTAANPVLSEEQEKKIRELADVCGATLSADVENQLEKWATIRDIVSFKADPREFVRKSLITE